MVVNKWASWCGPCRLEFPFFQAVASDRGDQIAFLGVNANDGTDAAETFLEELPRARIRASSTPTTRSRELFEGDRASPSTAFYDRNGELVYTQQGPYDGRAAISTTRSTSTWAERPAGSVGGG